MATMEKGDAFQGLVSAALEIARKREQTLSDLRQALESGNDRVALSLARKIVGLEDEQTSHPVN
jgi:hypothetical protein